MERIHKIIEDAVIELRDARISTLCGNGLAVREEDGTPSGVIRISTRNVIRMVLGALAAPTPEAPPAREEQD